MFALDFPLWFYFLFYGGPVLTVIWIGVGLVWLFRKFVWNRFKIVRK